MYRISSTLSWPLNNSLINPTNYDRANHLFNVLTVLT